MKYKMLVTDLDDTLLNDQLKTGEEVSFLKGNVFDAIFSSISMPWIFAPYNKNNNWMIDWWITNPVPVSLCKQLWADIVIAVNLNSDKLKKNISKKPSSSLIENNSFLKRLKNNVKEYVNTEIFSNNMGKQKNLKKPPNFINNLFDTIDIMQYNITNMKLEKDKPDIILNPKLWHIGLLDIDKAKETIQEWKNCVIRNKEKIQKLILD